MYKYFLIVSTVLVAVSAVEKTFITLPEEAAANTIKALGSCTEPQYIPEFLKAVRGGVEYDDKFKTTLYCVCKEAGFLKEDGRLNIEKASALFPDPELQKKTFGDCDSKIEDNLPEEMMIQMLKCFQQNSVYRIKLDYS